MSEIHVSIETLVTCVFPIRCSGLNVVAHRADLELDCRCGPHGLMLARMTVQQDVTTPDGLPLNSTTQVHRYKWLQRESKSDLIHALDSGLIAHIGFVREGKPMVIPMAYARDGDAILMHGSTGAGVNRSAKSGVDLVATITILDGLVYAESLFDSTVNYRCAIIMGTASPVPDEQKEDAIRIISDRLMPGRWEEVRKPTKRELAATYVLRLPLDVASVKIRGGGPDAEPVPDVWTGHLPIASVIGDPVMQDGVTAPLPDSIPRTRQIFDTTFGIFPA